MNSYLYSHYQETKAKFDKFSSRLQKSQDRGEFHTLSRRKQHFLISRVKKLWEKLRILEVQLKITTAGVSMAFLLMVSNVSAQDQFVLAPEKNPLPPVTINGINPFLLDIDNDGDLDLLVDAGYYGVGLYKNTGTKNEPSFEEVLDETNPFNSISGYGYVNMYSMINGADIDNDGDIDIITPYYIIRNTGTNESIAFTGENNNNRLPRNSDLGDIDGDGDLDIIWKHSYYDHIEVYENTGDAGYFNISSMPDTLMTAGWDEEIDGVNNTQVLDVDDDGDLDILVGVNINSYDEVNGYTREQTYKLLRNNGTAEVPEFELADDESNPYNTINARNIGLGDLDGDGDLDVLLSDAYSERGIHYFEINNDTAVENMELVTEFYDGIILPAEVITPQFLDYDNDGDLDIFAWAYDDANLYIEQIETDTQLKFRVSDQNEFDFLSGTSYIQIPFFVDLDIDGDMDIVRLDYDEDVDYVFVENTGSDENPVYSERSFTALSGKDIIALPAFVDLDGDEDMDMFFTLDKEISDDREVQTIYYESIGSDPTVFAERLAGANPLYQVRESNYESLIEYQVPVFSDVDEDGDMDALFTSYYGILYFENTGIDPTAGFIDKTETGPFSSIVMNYYSTLNMVDFDGDGDDDLFIHSRNGGTDYYENMGGSGVGIQLENIQFLETYPNPVANELTIKMSDEVSGQLDYEIVSLEGRSIENGMIENVIGEIEFKINTESYLPGYYFLRISLEGQRYVSKFVKQ